MFGKRTSFGGNTNGAAPQKPAPAAAPTPKASPAHPPAPTAQKPKPTTREPKEQVMDVDGEVKNRGVDS